MNIYSAAMKAADHIERNPGLFSFMEVGVPECGTPGCMVGWVAHFMGVPNEWGVIPDSLISRFCRAGPAQASGWPGFDATAAAEGFDLYDLHDNPAAAARYLRHYAAKYLAKPLQAPPDWQALAQRLAGEPRIPQTA